MIYVKILCHNALYTRIKRVLFGQLLKLVDTLKRLFVLAELQLNSVVAI